MTTTIKIIDKYGENEDSDEEGEHEDAGEEYLKSKVPINTYL